MKRVIPRGTISSVKSDFCSGISVLFSFTNLNCSISEGVGFEKVMILVF